MTINHLRVIAQEEAFQRAHLARTSSTELLRSSRNGNDKSKSSVEQSTINTFYSTKLNSLTSFLFFFTFIYLCLLSTQFCIMHYRLNHRIFFYKVLCFYSLRIMITYRSLFFFLLLLLKYNSHSNSKTFHDVMIVCKIYNKLIDQIL